MSRIFDSTQSGATETFIDTPSSSVYNSLASVTAQAWVNWNNTGSLVIWVKDPANQYNFVMQFEASGSNRFLRSFTAGNGLSVTNNQSIVANTWTHVLMTFSFLDGVRKIHIYVNGVESTYSTQTAESSSTPFDDSGSGWFIGDDGLGFGDGWGGNIAEFAVWNTVLTQPQITAAAASTTGIAGIASANLVGYWHLCGLASPEPDATANNNNGTLSTNPPTPGLNSPGFSSCSAPAPVPWSSTDSRNFGTFPNQSRTVNQVKIYDVQTSSNPAVPGTDSRTSGAPVPSGTYPQNSRTPGLYGPGE